MMLSYCLIFMVFSFYLEKSLGLSDVNIALNKIVHMKKGLWNENVTDGSKDRFATHEADADAWLIIDLIQYYHVQKMKIHLPHPNDGLDYFQVGRINNFTLNVLYSFNENEFTKWYSLPFEIKVTPEININLANNAFTARYVALRQSSQKIGKSSFKVSEIEIFGEVMHVEKYTGCYLEFLGNVPANVQSINECFIICNKSATRFFALQNGGKCFCGNDYNQYVSSSQCQMKCPNNVGYCGGMNTFSVYKILPEVIEEVNYYIGCFRDNIYNRDMGGFVYPALVTTETCFSICNEKYFTTQHAESCFCSANYGKYGAANNCNMKCKGNDKQICGGAKANSLYQRNKQLMLPGFVKSRKCSGSNYIDQSGNCISKSCLPGWKGPGCFERIVTESLLQTHWCDVANLSTALFTVCHFKAAYIGCFQYVSSTKSTKVSFVGTCVEFCKNEIDNMIAIKGGGECSCIKEIAAAVSSSFCNITCADKWSCGGNHFYSVYKGKPRRTHHVFGYSDKSMNETHSLEFKVPYTAEMCAHFCLEMNLTFFHIMKPGKCGCFQTLELIGYGRLGTMFTCDKMCTPNVEEVCKCYYRGEENKFTVFGTRFQYEFQRGLSSYSHCSINTFKINIFELVSKCPAGGCINGWIGDSCRERDCDINNGDCGSELKCIVSTVNNDKYVECVCPYGTVRNKLSLCEVFRPNLALHKPAYLSSTLNEYTANLLTDGEVYSNGFAHVYDSIAMWLAVDLEKLYCIGFVVVYNRMSMESHIVHRADNFVVRLNETFNTSGNYDIKNKVKLCGQWPSEAIPGGNPMRVNCVNFTLLSRFVIVQSNSDELALVEIEAYSVGCHNNNGNCADLKCVEDLIQNVTVIKCVELGDDLIITLEVPAVELIYGCFKRAKYEYEHNEYGLSVKKCVGVCKSKSFNISAVKAGLKCLCGNNMTVNDNTSLDDCYIGHFESYFVVEDCTEENYNCIQPPTVESEKEKDTLPPATESSSNALWLGIIIGVLALLTVAGVFFAIRKKGGGASAQGSASTQPSEY